MRVILRHPHGGESIIDLPEERVEKMMERIGDVQYRRSMPVITS